MERFDYQLFNMFSDVIRTIYSRMELASGESLTTQQMGYLHFFLDHEGCCQQDLVDRKLAGKATVSEFLLHMENEQLITRVRDESNRRRHLIFLTERGRRLAEEIKKNYETLCDQFMSEFTDEEKACFFSLMRKFLQN